MKKFYSNVFKAVAACMMLVAAATPATAATPKWEKCGNIFAPYSIFKTSTGRLLVGDYDSNKKGGIYYSDDYGDTWQKAQIMRDYNWNDFCEVPGPDGEKYIFAAGILYPSIARSEDDGETWITLSYISAMKDVPGIDKLEDFEGVGAVKVRFDPTYHRVYAVIQGFDGVVVYSDDYGETWSMTDGSGFQLFDPNYGYFYDFPYGMEYFNGNIYVMGMYHWYKLNGKTKKWTKVKRNGSTMVSNLMCEVTMSPDAKWLFATSPQERGIVEEQGYYPEFVIRTKDCAKFEVGQFPEGETYAYNRSMHHDGERLYLTVKTKAAYYSLDNGDTWKVLGNNYPGVFVPMMTSDDKYLYAAGYDAGGGSLDGIYRIAKKGLESGIEEVAADTPREGLDIDFDRYNFAVNAQGVSSIEIYNAAGRCVAKSAANRVNIAALPFGPYIYKVTTGAGQFSGKFFK